MDIQWIVIASASRLNTNGTLDIAGIFQSITFKGAEHIAPMKLLAKVDASPTEVGEEKTLTLQVMHERKGLIAATNLPYGIPDLTTWAKRTPFISLNLDDFDFLYPGKYTFILSIEGEYKNEESITVIHEGG